VKIIRIAKAGETSVRKPEGVVINVTDELPKVTYDILARVPESNSQGFFDQQALELNRALIDNLPGGTLNRLLAIMMYELSCDLRVAWRVEPVKQDAEPINAELLAVARSLVEYREKPWDFMRIIDRARKAIEQVEKAEHGT
jgi:hypothetical protein